VYINLAIIAVFAFIYSAVAGRVERSMIFGPIVFLAFGLICGPYGLGKRSQGENLTDDRELQSNK